MLTSSYRNDAILTSFLLLFASITSTSAFSAITLALISSDSLKVGTAFRNASLAFNFFFNFFSCLVKMFSDNFNTTKFGKEIFKNIQRLLTRLLLNCLYSSRSSFFSIFTHSAFSSSITFSSLFMRFLSSASSCLPAQ